MPINRYFSGHGSEVMANMRKEYPDEKKAKSVFYATAKKRGETPGAGKKGKRGFAALAG